MKEKVNNQNIINKTYSEQFFGKNGTNIQTITKAHKMEHGNLSNSKFLFMCPIFNTNKIIGAIDDESAGKVEINFKKVFGDNDIQLNDFPQGGAFCNYGPFLYFTGGQEKQIGIGKLFLEISILKTHYKPEMIKLPCMKYTHWNHSMINYDNYIYVIGGYNSNKCECFNMKTLKWELMPNLNSEERQRPVLTIYKDYLYVFMGYTQYNILDSVEKINIKKSGVNNWEKLSISNPDNINLKFYETGIYDNNEKLYFLGGKIGKGNEEKDYKNEIYIFNFNKIAFYSTKIYFSEKMNFIENKFHKYNNEKIGNFIDLFEGCLAIVNIPSFLK